jgi:hypothetical protein
MSLPNQCVRIYFRHKCTGPGGMSISLKNRIFSEVGKIMEKGEINFTTVVLILIYAYKRLL